MTGQNQWVKTAAELYPNFRLFETPMLSGLMIFNQKMDGSHPVNPVILWVRTQDPNIGNINIVQGEFIVGLILFKYIL